MVCVVRVLISYLVCRQDSVHGPLLFLLYIVDLPGLLQNVLVGYADDSTLLCRITHPRDRHLWQHH